MSAARTQAAASPWAPPGGRGDVVAALAAAVALGLVAPLALGPNTWQQRGALAVLVFALGLFASGRGAPRLPLAPALIAAGIAVVLLLSTLPVAERAERAAEAAARARGGQRLLALNDPDGALPHFDAALRLAPGDPTARVGAAEAHVALAERAVQAGLTAANYARAGDDLDQALALAPSDQARRLADAVSAVRQADQIWNQYDWPRTIGELEKAYSARPDLPGLKGKLYAAEVSYAAVLIGQGNWGAAQSALQRAHEVGPG
jgi:tetratricopeptide (TPR) repeat protein